MYAKQNEIVMNLSKYQFIFIFVKIGLEIKKYSGKPLTTFHVSYIGIMYTSDIYRYMYIRIMYIGDHQKEFNSARIHKEKNHNHNPRIPNCPLF